MSQFWSPPWEQLAATGALDIVLRHEDEHFQLGGERFYLLQKRYDSDRVQKMLGTFDRDPVTLCPRAIVWHQLLDPADEYPDRDRFEAVSYGSFGENELTRVHDKDIFERGKYQFALDYRVREVSPEDGSPLPAIVYLVVNAPPHNGSDPVLVTYKNASPAMDFNYNQPVIANQPGYENSTLGYRQWLNHNRRFRGRILPHTIPLAVPEEMVDLTVGRDGMTQAESIQRQTSVPPYSPILVEHDILVRKSNDAHYEIKWVKYDWGLGYANGQSRLKAQLFEAVLLSSDDPKSRISVQTA